MKKINFILLLTILIFTSKLVIGQEIAVTERGDSVVLFSNGTWDYYANYLSNNEDETEIRINSETFIKPKSSTKKINGSNQAYEI